LACATDRIDAERKRKGTRRDHGGRKTNERGSFRKLSNGHLDVQLPDESSRCAPNRLVGCHRGRTWIRSHFYSGPGSFMRRAENDVSRVQGERNLDGPQHEDKADQKRKHCFDCSRSDFFGERAR
jgi:hypothetical protein